MPLAAPVAPAAPVTGVVARSVSEARRNCGVWATIGYCVPLCGSIQNESTVCPLPDSDVSRSLATSVSREPEQRRLAAVDEDVQGRVVEGLLDVQIHEARDLVHARQQLVGIAACGTFIEARHLHVER